MEDQKYTFENEKDINSQIETLEKEVLDQTDIRKKFEIAKKLLIMKTDLETKKIKIANKSVKKKILEIVKRTAIRQGVYNNEQAK